MPNRAFGTLHDPLPLPAYRGDRLAFAPHTAGLSSIKPVKSLDQPFPDPKTGSTEVRYTADGGALGVGAGSTISGYEIAGIGHGVDMRLVSLSRFGLSRIGLRAGLCAASAADAPRL